MLLTIEHFFECGETKESLCCNDADGDLIVCWWDERNGCWRIRVNGLGILKGEFSEPEDAIHAFNFADSADFYDPEADTPWKPSKLKKGLPGSNRKYAGQLLAVRQSKSGHWFATLDVGDLIPGFHRTEEHARRVAEQAALNKKARA